MKQKGLKKYTPDFIDSLEPGQIFVFGSNLIGYHSGGASMMAMQRFGAIWGQAEGPQGQCYAIPVDVRGEAIDNVSTYMKRHINKFLEYAKTHNDQTFLVPRIGCGAAGFDEEFMAPFFKEALKMNNVRLPESFVNILEKSKTAPKDNDTQRVFNLIILDESGSMSTIAKQAVSGLNETFQTIRNAQKEHQEQQHFISFITFNSAKIRTVFNRQAVSTDKKIKWTDYKPDDCTPLFDAMGRSLNELKKHVGDDDVVLVTIITDGYENASREYSGHDIKRLVAELKGKGWVFAYIGTNQDVDAVADDMGIRSRMCYDYSPTGADCMFELERTSKRRFFDRLASHGKSFLMDEQYDYFESEEESEKEPDITWDMNDNTSSPSDSQEVEDKDSQEAKQKQESLEDNETPEEPEEVKTFWGKMKNFLKK